MSRFTASPRSQVLAISIPGAVNRLRSIDKDFRRASQSGASWLITMGRIECSGRRTVASPRHHLGNEATLCFQLLTEAALGDVAENLPVEFVLAPGLMIGLRSMFAGCQGGGDETSDAFSIFQCCREFLPSRTEERRLRGVIRICMNAYFCSREYRGRSPAEPKTIKDDNWLEGVGCTVGST